MRKMLFLCVQPRDPELVLSHREWKWGSPSAQPVWTPQSSLQVPKAHCSLWCPSPRACCDSQKPPRAISEGVTGPALLENQESSILSINGAGLGMGGSLRSSPAQTILCSHEIPQPHSCLTALEEFCISWWSWGWDLIFFPQVFSYLLVNESQKDFCHFTMGKETDCTVTPAFILIPANTTLQILECNV